MLESEITITNKTMDLRDCKDAWFFDEKYQVWCLEDILYTDRATTPKFQRLSIFVPKEYMSAPGVIDHQGQHGAYRADEVPVIFENNSAGYMQMPHTYLGGPREFARQYLEEGFVYVTCGNRGHESKDATGKYVGKSPINLIDLKMGIRFLRHNAACIPGNLNKMISVGWSAGGAMSTLLALTGDSENYRSLLEENGAFMEESDAVYAAQIYCPIIDLEHADLAYEWMYHADKENEESPAGHAGIMTPFEEAVSDKLYERYIRYFNGLKCKHPKTGEELVIGADGRSGNGYDYLMEKLSESAGIFLKKLSENQAGQDYSVEDYLAGNYEEEKPAPMGNPDDKENAGKSDAMQGFAGPGVAMHKPVKQLEPPTLGDLVSRPPKGMPPMPEFKPPMIRVHGKEKAWLSWDGKNARIRDLDTYVLQHRRRMKPCTSFDVWDGNSGENKVFGNESVNAVHFNADIAEILEELKDDFPAEYEKYSRAYQKVATEEGLAQRKYLINPLNYIHTKEVAKQAEYYRIRVGASDADTSASVSMTLACKLAESGKKVDYQFVWEQPHAEADYPGEVIEWIRSIL